MKKRGCATYHHGCRIAVTLSQKHGYCTEGSEHSRKVSAQFLRDLLWNQFVWPAVCLNFLRYRPTMRVGLFKVAWHSNCWATPKRHICLHRDKHDFSSRPRAK